MPLLINGYITLAFKQGDGEPNEYGIPQDSLTWGNPIECMYRTVRDDRRGAFTDGEYRQSMYEVHIATALAPEGVDYAKRAKLTTIEGIELGEHSVQRVERLRLTNRVAFDLGI